ncbi:hypothetical protein ABZU75_21370 [Streptosporangium sp. NPDC005286]|uniref:hypothetical protein n=1 Tax=Streptosporangium sp. NPDC005286 TaxID=3154463 RepID=UPI0033B253AE
MTAKTITAAVAGVFELGDLPVNRIGFGAMRLTQHGTVFGNSAPSGRAGSTTCTSP